MNKHRLQKEQSFFNERYGDDDSRRKGARKYYSVNRRVWNRYVEIIYNYCRGKKLLEYGCGTGSRSEQWSKVGAFVTGIDISTEGIKKAKARVSISEYDAGYFVMNAEDTEFDDSSFDIVVGTGIIHHLDLLKSFQELNRILKKDGHAVFIEPLGYNPFINLYRALTPQMRTEDEHPLKQADLRLLGQYFKVEFEYYSMFTLLAVPFRNAFFFNKLCDFLGLV
ncbi:class I SAM-dependent methyltransferase, partial [Candidatus Neomarinimicrobiota bacterium]